MKNLLLFFPFGLLLTWLAENKKRSAGTSSATFSETSSSSPGQLGNDNPGSLAGKRLVSPSLHKTPKPFPREDHKHPPLNTLLGKQKTPPLVPRIITDEPNTWYYAGTDPHGSQTFTTLGGSTYTTVPGFDPFSYDSAGVPLDVPVSGGPEKFYLY